MKVKVRKIAAPYEDVPTASLEAVLRNHVHDRLQVRVSVEQLYDIMEELARRDQIAGTRFRSNQEAWEDFVVNYAPADAFVEERKRILEKEERRVRELFTPHKLTPSPDGKECLGNGTWEGYDCQCPDCDWYLICFPEEKV